MSTNNEASSPTKRSSLSSRASKIPQKIAQSTFFALRPSSSTLTTSSVVTNSDSISTRLSQMFRPRTASETVFKDTSIQEIDNRIQHLSLSKSPTFHTSSSIDIQKGQQTKKCSQSHELPQKHSKIDTYTNTYTQSNISSPSPYSTSSPERTDFYSYHHNITPNNEFSSNGFSPLSLTNSTISLADSLINSQLTISTSLMPSNSKDASSFEGLVADTTKELATAILDYTSYLLDLFNTTDDFAFAHLRELDSIGTERIQVLVKACSEPSCAQKVQKLQNQLRDIQTMVQSNSYQIIPSFDVKTQGSYIKLLIADIQHICKECLKLFESFPNLSSHLIDNFRKESPKLGVASLSASYYRNLEPDQIDQKAMWFRHHFVGKPYLTLIGSFDQERSTSTEHTEGGLTKKKRQSLTRSRNSKTLMSAFLNSSHDLSSLSTSNQTAEQSVGIISIIHERTKVVRNSVPISPQSGSQYRIIVRSNKPDQKRFLIHEAKVKETLAQLEARGEGNKTDKTSSYNDSRLRALINRNSNSHTENNSSSRMIRAAILSVCPNLNLQSFKELTAETTILAGLEKDLLKYDEIQIPKRYKFGVITTQKGQTKEEAWFSNTGLSSEFKDFMNILGTKIELKGYTGYAAGLDIKTGETGKYSYVSKWNDVDIMFHVAPLMPFSKNDEQQVMRKRFIGNDIVCVVFIEGDQPFNPNAIRSQFIHIYILVRAEYVNGSRYWRVEILRNSNVCDFGPPLPSPPLFHDADALKEFLTLKLVNAENAALKSERFRMPNAKAHVSLLTAHVQTGLSFHQPQVIRSASANRLALNKPSSAPPQKDAKKAQRPRSVNEKASSRGLSNGGSSRLLQEAILDEQKRNKITEPEEEIPPVPNISRSTLLQDFRKGIASSSRRIKGAASDDLFNRRQSQLRSPDKSSQNQSITKTDTEEGKSKEKVNNNLAKKENKNDKASISESVRKENSTTVSSIKNNTTPKPNAPVRPSQLLLSVASKSTNVANLKNSPSAAVSWR